MIILMAFLTAGCGREGPAELPVVEAGHEAAQIVPKVLLIGIDGATMDIILPMIAGGKLPEFKRLIDSGVGARLQSQDPLISPAIWTSIASGYDRAEHGVEHFLTLETLDTTSPRLNTSYERRVPALWNTASVHGRTVNVVDWWMTWPAEEVNGTVVSDRAFYGVWESWTGSEARDFMTYPADLYREVKGFILDPNDPPLDEVRGMAVLTPDEEREMLSIRKPVITHGLSILKFGYCEQRSYEDIALFLLSRSQPDLAMVFLIATDPICHTFWHFYQPGSFPGGVDPGKAARLGELIPSIYEHNDRYLEKLLSKVGSNTTVMIVSDHGFRASGRLPEIKDEVSYRYVHIDRVEKLDRPLNLGMSGTHDLMGTFIASGYPILKGAKLRSEPSIFDIAPTVLALMGLPVARDMPGRVIEEIIDRRFLEKHPVRYIDTYKGIAKGPRDKPGEEPGEKKKLEYLRSLGYIR